MKFVLLALVFLAGIFLGRFVWRDAPAVVAEEDVVIEGVAIEEAGKLTALVSGGGVDNVELGELVEGIDLEDEDLVVARLFGRTSGMDVAEIDRLLGEIARMNPANRKVMEDALILRLMEIDPVVAWQMLGRSRPGDTDESVLRRQNDWVHGIFTHLAENDLEAGMRLVELDPESWSKRRAIEYLLDASLDGDRALELITWAKSVDPKFNVYVDPVGASAWIAGLEDGVIQQGAARQLANSIRDEDPEAAFAWSHSLHEDSRMHYMETAVETWGKVDEEAARAAVMAAELSEEDRGSLLGKLGGD